jgi:hypothetical protein
LSPRRSSRRRRRGSRPARGAGGAARAAVGEVGLEVAAHAGAARGARAAAHPARARGADLSGGAGAVPHARSWRGRSGGRGTRRCSWSARGARDDAGAAGADLPAGAGVAAGAAVGDVGLQVAAHAAALGAARAHESWQAPAVQICPRGTCSAGAAVEAVGLGSRQTPAQLVVPAPQVTVHAPRSTPARWGTRCRRRRSWRGRSGVAADAVAVGGARAAAHLAHAVGADLPRGAGHAAGAAVEAVGVEVAAGAGAVGGARAAAHLAHAAGADLPAGQARSAHPAVGGVGLRGRGRCPSSWWCRPPQETRHMPPEQTCPPGHAVPQAPQLALSLERSRQAPMQSVRPAPQGHAHARGADLPRGAGRAARAAVLAVASARRGRRPSQLVSPAPHIVAQVPPEQSCPKGQRVPHIPQFSRSVLVLVQNSPPPVAPASAMGAGTRCAAPRSAGGSGRPRRRSRPCRRCRRRRSCSGRSCASAQERVTPPSPRPARALGEPRAAHERADAAGAHAVACRRPPAHAAVARVGHEVRAGEPGVGAAAEGLGWAPHVGTHAPFWQSSPVPQRRPQAPQCSALDATETQLPPQARSPSPQVTSAASRGVEMSAGLPSPGPPPTTVTPSQPRTQSAATVASHPARSDGDFIPP